MAASASTKRTPCQSAWPDLPWDLLGDVLFRLPSLADRVRLRAVCRPWRAGAELQPTPRPQLPWLALPDGTVLDMANNTTHPLQIPDDDDGPCYSAGEGNMFFQHHNDGRCSVVNGFSGAATPLPELAALLRSHMVNPYDENKWYDDLDDPRHYVSRNSSEWMKIRKVAMSSVKKHNRRLMIVAVLAASHDDYHSTSRVFISTCRPAGEVNSCVVMPETCTIFDIAFFQGKLYARLSVSDELVAIDLTTTSSNGGCCLLDKPPPPGDVVEPEAEPTYTSWIQPSELQLKHLRFPRYHGTVDQHLVESNGKLLMVRRRFHRADYNGPLCLGFKVFEAVLTGGDPRRPLRRRWKKACSLDGRALFVGTPHSRSFVASDMDGAREDCIYFSLRFGYDPLRFTAVYSMVEKKVMSLMPASVSWRNVQLKWCCPRFPAWFFPVEV